MSDIDFEQQQKDEPVATHRIDYDQYDVKIRHTRVDWIERLAYIVADANFCKILVHKGSSRITLVGTKQHTAVAEYLFVTLQRAAEKISNKAYDVYRNEERRKMIEAHGEDGRHGSMPHTFGFRDSFINTFISRLRDRMAETQKDATSSSMALVRVDRSKAAVNAFMAQFTSKANALSTSVRFNRTGVERGRSAADAINLDANAIGKGTVTAKKQIS
jgi:hypothetical protein